MILYALTIFLSAFLLFQIQPLIAKFILPWYGGGPSVWTTALLFFQVLLLGGYAYAHLLARLRGRAQAIVHGFLLAVSLLMLPVVPEPAVWKPRSAEDPAAGILFLLAANVGLPYLVLSATGPLLQRWFHDRFPARSPFRLYALSNTGSLLALVTFPFLFEPLLDAVSLARLWSGAYLVFGAGTVACALAAAVPSRREPAPGGGGPAGTDASPPGFRRILTWVLLAAGGSALLMGTTNQISIEVSVVPFLWILPLSLYLMTFIIAFDSPRRYDRRVFGPLLVVSTAGAVLVLGLDTGASLWVHAVSLNLALFAACMVVHGELVRRKPHPRSLTLFYLMVAAGGAVGGVFVAVLAPLLFTGFWEFHTSLAACCTLAVLVWLGDRFGGRDRRVRILGPPLFAGLLALYAVLVGRIKEDGFGALHVSRNFYGVLRVEDTVEEMGIVRQMLHGRVSHGFQYLDEALRGDPVAYYGPESGIGLLLRHRSGSDRGLRVGVIGLGTGTLAAYLEAPDTLRFYEINPEVETAAREFFTYLRDSRGTVEVVTGDGRVLLAREREDPGSPRYDVLAVDAFSSGSIPVHLLTAEAAELYRRRLQPDGVLALHLSNQFLDLVPVGLGMARHLGFEAALISSPDREASGYYAADWLLLAADPARLRVDEIRNAAVPLEGMEPLAWTDRYAGLWQVVAP